jgi:hypothetical protein
VISPELRAAYPNDWLIEVRRGSESVTLAIPTRKPAPLIGIAPIDMITGPITLNPTLAPSVPATMPDAKPKEKERKRTRNIEHEPTDALI